MHQTASWEIGVSHFFSAAFPPRSAPNQTCSHSCLFASKNFVLIEDRFVTPRARDGCDLAQTRLVRARAGIPGRSQELAVGEQRLLGGQTEGQRQRANVS